MPDALLSLLNKTDLSVPVTKLIESVSAGIGAIYAPTGIRRRARAERDADWIATESRNEIRQLEIEGFLKSVEALRAGGITPASLEGRALLRLSTQETRRQENIENIVEKAVAVLPCVVSDDPVSEDWMTHFLGIGQEVSDEEMQKIWARILAGEVAVPGSYSRRTMETLRVLSKDEARRFRDMIPYVWESQEDRKRARILFAGRSRERLQANGAIWISNISDLADAGLLSRTITSYKPTRDHGLFTMWNGGIAYVMHVVVDEPYKRFAPFQVYMLTQTGVDLLSLCERAVDAKYLAEFKMDLHDRGIEHFCRD